MWEIPKRLLQGLARIMCRTKREARLSCPSRTDALNPDSRRPLALEDAPGPRERVQPTTAVPTTDGSDRDTSASVNPMDTVDAIDRQHSDDSLQSGATEGTGSHSSAVYVHEADDSLVANGGDNPASGVGHRSPSPAMDSPVPSSPTTSVRSDPDGAVTLGVAGNDGVSLHRPVDPAAEAAAPVLTVSGSWNEGIKHALSGTYHHIGTYQDHMIFRRTSDHSSGDAYLYYWKQQDGYLATGWWFGPVAGGDSVWAFNHEYLPSGLPPARGWATLTEGGTASSIIYSGPDCETGVDVGCDGGIFVDSSAFNGPRGEPHTLESLVNGGSDSTETNPYHSDVVGPGPFDAHWEITTRGERHTGEQASASYKTSLEDHTTTSLSAGNEHDHSQSLSNCVDVGTRPLPVFEDATTEEDAPVGVGSGSPSLGGDVELQPTGTREQRSSSYQTQLDDPHLGADVGVQHGDQSEMQPLGTTVSASSMGGDGNATVTFGAIPAVAYACLLPSYMGPVSGDGLHQSCADLDLSGGGYGMTAVDSSAMPAVAYGGGLPCELPIDVGPASGDGFDLSCVDVDHSGNGDGMATANSSAIPAIAIAPGSFSTDLGPSSGDGFDQSCVDVDRSRHVVGGDNTVV